MIPMEKKVGNYIVVYTPEIEMMSICKEGDIIPVRINVEEVKRLDGESASEWHKRAVKRAEEI